MHRAAMISNAIVLQNGPEKRALSVSWNNEFSFVFFLATECFEEKRSDFSIDLDPVLTQKQLLSKKI